MSIGLDAIKLNYIEIAEARKMSGLRIVLGAYPVPGPWRESCKGVYYVKGLDYTPVRTGDPGSSDLEIGMGGTQSELRAWTGQHSAPVVAYNDEPPRSKWSEQLTLAERLQPDPPLIPDDIEQRIRMFGLAQELLGERGLVWDKRHLMGKEAMGDSPPDEAERAFWDFLRSKYGYSPEAEGAAGKRIAEILNVLDTQLAAQKKRGSRYLIGDRLSALDIYWACACGLLCPMEEARCPMFDGMRGPYGNTNPDVAAALSSDLIAHRDFIYDEHLELPIVF